MKIFGKIVYGIFTLVLLGFAGLFLASRMSIGGIEAKIVKSGSMEPAIPTGAIVVIRPVHTYAVGDVITFGEDTKNAIPTTHRIVAMRTEGTRTLLTTKGDANEEADSEETDVANVIGKIQFSVPYVGYVLDFARQPKGFIALIGIPASLIMLEGLITIVQEIRTIRRRKRNEEALEDLTPPPLRAMEHTVSEPIRSVVSTRSFATRQTKNEITRGIDGIHS